MSRSERRLAPPGRADANPLPLDLALGRDAAHDVFTWDVLARPIDEPWLRIDAVSAMNAAMLARGWTAAGSRQHHALLHNKAFATSEPDGPDWRQKQLTRHDGSNRRKRP
jgi:hypothetical protein